MTRIRIARTIAVTIREYDALKCETVFVRRFDMRKEVRKLHQLYLLFSSDWMDRNRKNAVTDK